MSEIHIKGLAELDKFLQQLPVKLERNVLRGSLRAGAKVLEAEAKARAPVGPPSSENVRLYGGYAGALRDSIRVTTSSKRGRVTASVKAGGKNKKTKADVFYAHMVEFGTRAHTITAKAGGWLSFGGIFAKKIQHPGTAPHPFMRPALDGMAGAAVNATAEYMRVRITKEGLDASGVILEGDE